MYWSLLSEFCVLHSCQHFNINVNNFLKPPNVPIIDLGRWQATRTDALYNYLLIKFLGTLYDREERMRGRIVEGILKDPSSSHTISRARSTNE